LNQSRITSLATLTVALSLALTGPDALARKRESLIESVVNAYETNHSFEVPATGSIEVAFSPSEGSEALVVKVVDSARSELRVLAYSFTSAPVRVHRPHPGRPPTHRGRAGCPAAHPQR